MDLVLHSKTRHSSQQLCKFRGGKFFSVNNKTYFFILICFDLYIAFILKTVIFSVPAKEVADMVFRFLFFQGFCLYGIQDPLIKIFHLALQVPAYMEILLNSVSFRNLIGLPDNQFP